MKRILLCLVVSLALIDRPFGQNIFNPADPIIRFDANQPLGSLQHPNPAIPGMQKWVSTPTIGVSTGSNTFDASSFKQYFINFNGQPMAFRMKYPKSYNSDPNKKYPVMLFLHGGGEVGCPTNGGVYNNERPIWLGGAYFRDRVDAGQFDGFLLYPQFVITNGCFSGWLSAPSPNFDAICAFMDSMAKYVRADIDRVTANGLSGGGYGCFRMAAGWPKYIAKIMPTSTWGPTTNAQKFVHIPIWFATGGQDPEPSPEQAQACLAAMKKVGADIRYTLFEELGHNCWYQHWSQPDYIPEMNASHKANPLVFFQHNEFCSPDDINAKLGITPGFYAYEWQKDGQTIASSQIQSDGTQTTTFIDNTSIISYTGNEITVKDFGTYRVRFKRTSGSDWTIWSPKPAVIKSKSATQTAAIQVDGPHSKVLTALDGSTTVPLTLPEGYLNYQWFRVSDNAVVDTFRTFNAPVGVYKARYNEEFGCSTEFSPEFTVVDANGDPKPSAATGLTSVPLSQTAVKLDWVQDGSSGDTSAGFEVYRATVSGGPYTFVRLLARNIKTFSDTGLVTNTTYYYRVRAVNGTGAAAASNEGAAKTVTDNMPPTAPSNLVATVKSKTDVNLKWNASTDNVGVVRYDIYVNGTKLYTTTQLQFTVGSLDSTAFYNFVIKAADLAGNISPASNQFSINTVGKQPSYNPGVPGSFTATAVNYTEIKLNWTDTLSNETGFEIVRSSTEGGPYEPVATADSNTTSFTDSGLAASQTFYYKIRAISAASQSDFSPSVSAMTGALPETPIPPTELAGTVSPSNYVALNWLDNSNNETSFDIYRSTDNTTFTLLSSQPANSNVFTDTSASGTTKFYYYVVAVNGAGNSEHSDTILIKAGNNAPVLNGLQNIFVRSGETKSLDFTTSDADGDSVTVYVYNQPSFVRIAHPSAGNYTIKATPTSDNAGVYALKFTAVDIFGKSSAGTITITVGDKNARSVFVNFGSNSKPAASPWNNWLGARAAGDVLTGLADETGDTTGFSITTVDAWSGLTDMGHITGNNSGVFPDDVLRSGLADTASVKQIKVSGLNKEMQYNLVFAASQNEGITASSSYQVDTETATLNGRYNMQSTANLNNLVPDANGDITVTIKRAADAATFYLNAMAIEEISPTSPMLAPGHLYAETLNKNTVNLWWNDRTARESGYLLVRASDSVFKNNVVNIPLPANAVAYKDTSLTPNTKYWYRIKAVDTSDSSDFSNRYRVVTPEMLIYVNFNTTIASAPAPWNSLTAPPLAAFTTDFLKNELNVKTAVTMTLTKEFNGEFTAGVNTGNNSGMVPDNALRADYWLDKKQKITVRRQRTEPRPEIYIRLLWKFFATRLVQG